MQSKAITTKEYIDNLPEDRKGPIESIKKLITQKLEGEFLECMNYGMLGFVVPHSKYPDGYHCDPKLPLPYINLASQKNFIALYHMGMYADKELMDWFVSEYPKYCKTKLDMGKSCVRFKKMDQIPYQLIGELIEKMSVDRWISIYEANFKKK